MSRTSNTITQYTKNQSRNVKYTPLEQPYPDPLFALAESVSQATSSPRLFRWNSTCSSLGFFNLHTATKMLKLLKRPQSRSPPQIPACRLGPVQACTQASCSCLVVQANNEILCLSACGQKSRPRNYTGHLPFGKFSTQSPEVSESRFTQILERTHTGRKQTDSQAAEHKSSE